MVYRFFDTDITGCEEYDISGDEYKTLLKICGRYSAVVSFYCEGDVIPLPELEQYRITVNDTVFKKDTCYCHYNDKDASVVYYCVCDELLAFMAKQCDSIFQWINGWGFTNPTDPIFYREDGSVLFSSVIHEGILTLCPCEGENVEGILKNQLWNEAEK